MCIQTLQETRRESNQKQVTSTKKNISTPIDKKTISKYSLKNPKTQDNLNFERCQNKNLPKERKPRHISTPTQETHQTQQINT